MGVALLVGTNKGLVVARAEDARESWDVGELQFKGWKITTAARDGGGRYYVGAAHEIYGAAVMVSDDLTNWRQIENGPKYAEGTPGNDVHLRIIARAEAPEEGVAPVRQLDQIWTFHLDGERIYAGVSEAGLFYSDDRGETWEGVAGLNDHPERGEWGPGAGGLCAHAVMTDKDDPQRMWVGISAVGVLRSDDGGATWAGKNENVSKFYGFCVHGLAQDPDDASVIYRQDHRGMYKTTDGGDRWELIENGLPMGTVGGDHRAVFGFPIVIDPETKAVLAVPLEGDEYHVPHEGMLRVYRTTNGGASWEAMEKGLPSEPTFTSVLRGAMSVDRMSPCGVYFGTTSGAVYASADVGESWARLPMTLSRILSVKAFAE